MRYLLLFLVIPFYAFSAAPTECERLQQIAGDLEKKIQTMSLPTEVCTALKPEDLGLPQGHLGFDKTWDYRCKDEAAINLQLKSIENEIALLNGLTALKNEIEQAKVAIAKPTKGTDTVASSKAFYQNLKIASDIELFLAANSSKSENILSLAANAEEDVIKDRETFNAFLTRNCSNYKNEKSSICNVKDFTLDQETFDTIKDLIKVGSKTTRKFNKQQVSDLRKALEIKKGTETSTYTEILKDFKKPEKDGLLTSEEIEKLIAMPEITSNSDYGFLKSMKQAQKTLKGAKSEIYAQSTFPRFSGYVTDLKKRQEWELRSKMSLILKQFEKEIPDSARVNCENARKLTAVEECLDALMSPTNEKVNNTQRSAIGDMKNEMKYGQDHLTRLDSALDKCIPSAEYDYPAECDKILTKNLSELVQKANVLNELKKKIQESSPALRTYRNFALENLLSAKCMKDEGSSISNCYDYKGDKVISPDAITLSGATSDILYVMDKPKDPAKIDELCKSNSTEVIPFKEELCKIKDVKKTFVAVKKDEHMNPIAPVSSVNTDQYLSIAGAIGKIALNYFAPTPPPQPPQIPMNPYQAMPGGAFPYGPAYIPSAAQQIVYPGAVQGLGVYRQTVGLPPYSSIPSNARTSSPYDWGSSPAMNLAVGY